MLLRLGEKFGTNQANAPLIKEVLHEYLLSRPQIDSQVRIYYLIFTIIL